MATEFGEQAVTALPHGCPRASPWLLQSFTAFRPLVGVQGVGLAGLCWSSWRAGVLSRLLLVLRVSTAEEGEERRERSGCG